MTPEMSQNTMALNTKWEHQFVLQMLKSVRSTWHEQYVSPTVLEITIISEMLWVNAMVPNMVVHWSQNEGL